MSKKSRICDQIVYLLQGGGALGSYQAGVCEALLEHDYAPDWLVGTSIGAINASIIAGNKPHKRVEKLHEFWDMVSNPISELIRSQNNLFLQEYQNFLTAFWITLTGQPNFFRPRMMNPLIYSENTPDKISFYDTGELRETLRKVIDFELINKCPVRLTLGAVRIQGGNYVRFDNTHHLIGPEHIMASSALPPGFPAIKIDEEYYWDGGLSSNTPFAVVLEEKVPQKLLCFIVNLFAHPEHIPTSFYDVLKVKKEIVYASRHKEVLHYFCELHYLQHALSELSQSMKNNLQLDTVLDKIKETGHPTALNIVRFHYRDRSTNLWSKDFNFSISAIKEHWEAGYRDAKKALEKSIWINAIIDETGAVIHEI